MSLVCFASFKGSPGTTLTALATAAAWPTDGNRRKLLLEADADGGALALRYQLPTKPGLISLAAAARRGLSKDQIWDHAQSLPGGLPVVLAPDGPEQANEVLRGSGRELGQWLSALPDVDVIADVGRLSIGSAAFELVSAADAVLGVVRPTAIELQPAAQRMVALSAYGLRVGWVLIGEKPYTANDVSRAYGLPVVHVVEHDDRGAKQMETGTNPNKLRRSSLVRSIAGLADTLSEWLHPAGAENWAPPTSAASSGATPPAAAGAPAPETMVSAAPPTAEVRPAPPVEAPTPSAAPIQAPPPDPDAAVTLPPAPASPDALGHSAPASPASSVPPPAPPAPAPGPAPSAPGSAPVPVETPSAPLVSTTPGPNVEDSPAPIPPPGTPPPPEHKPPAPGSQASDQPASEQPAPNGTNPVGKPDGLPGIESGTPSLAILAAQRGQELVAPGDKSESKTSDRNGHGSSS